MNNRYRQIFALLLMALLPVAQATAQLTINGNVFGGGNKADVQVNTTVEIGGGTITGNVYGGGNLGDVGTIDKTDNTNYNYTWTGNSPATESPSATIVSGLCTVEISGGTVGPTEGNGDADHGNVFGAGKGEATTFWCEKGIVYKAVVSISAGTVKRNVYGGGRIGRVENDTQVTIGDGTNSGAGSAGTYAPIIGGNVFGAGAGALTHGYSALVRNNSKVIVQGNAKVENSVYGGGEKATVGKYNIAKNQTEADAHNVKIGMPYETVSGGECTVEILGHAKIGPDASGNVFGGGMGVDPTNDTYAYVTTGTDEEKKSSRPRRMTLKPDPLPANYIFDETDNAKVVWEYFSDRDAYFDFLQTLALASNTDLTIKGNASVKGSVYGGSESGFIQDHTVVKIEGGTILTTGTDANGNLLDGNIFGGGKGLPVFSEAGKVKGNTNLTISEGTIAGSVYGGGELGDVGTITKNFTSYNYQWKKNDGNTDNDLHNNDISGTNTNTGICNVTISGGETTGNVFGAGKGKDDTWWCEKAMVFATNVSISGASTKVYGSVFGGGEIGRVEDDAKVTIGTSGGSDTPNITGSVFGAGKGLATHGYSALLRGNTEVTVQGGATVGHSVYGGGEIATVGRYVVVNGVPTEPDGGGDCTVTIKDNAVITENVFGAGQGVDPATYRATDNAVTGEKRSRRMMVYDPGRDYAGGPYEWEYITTYGTSYDGPKFVWEYFTEAQYRTFLETLALASDTEVEIGGTSGKTTKVNGSVYGGSESGFLQRHTQVTIQDYCEIGTTSGTTGGNVFGGGKGLAGYAAGGRVSGYTNVAISGGTTCTMHGSVYGGGENGIVKGGVKVDLSGGTVNKDVYGGGALADTNTGNGIDYIAVPEIPSNPKNAGLYEKTYVSAGSGTAVAGTTYYEYKDGKHVVKSVAVGDPLTGLYVVEYNETEDETADANKTYYTQTHPTTVNLLGGTIKGDAYGGGLGQKTGFNSAASDIPAVVHGDIDVTLDGTKFDITYYADTGHTDVVKSGRVFGCNNLLGSPQGDVTVTVNRTVAGNTSRTSGTVTEEVDGVEQTIDKRKSVDPDNHSYELAAVYGGGNLAPYEATGKKAHVIINGCDLTSILMVYGGGNAAPVPETDVDINSCYEIGSVFGGGNGKDMYKNDTGWKINPGANIGTQAQPGNANTMIYGGTVHEAYGGSNEKGTIYGDVVIDVAENIPGDTCPLDVAQLVGAGKNADVNGDLKIIMGCKPNTKIPLVFGGADNANVNGNVELTVTSGNFGKIFGGNNNGGRIKGHIILNIQETTCIPLNIDHLYLCGNNAAYSQYGYYVKTTKSEGTPIGHPSETPVLTSAGKLDLIPRESATDPHLPVKSYSYNESGVPSWEVYTEGDAFTGYAAPVLNVISCTSIGEVFGGGFGTEATVYGNPTVNINMIPGAHADEITRNGVTGNANALGEIGDVYGGGDAAAVYGNTTVNIGTATSTSVYRFAQVNGEYKVQYQADGVTPIQDSETVVGAYITGDVYGGGKLADVGKYHEVSDPIVENRNNVVIDLTGNTNVNIGAKLNPSTNVWESVTEGTAGVFIGGDVYGGGMGDDTSFFCDAAMVLGNQGTTESSNDANNDGGGTHVRIGNGTIHGNVYGGGKIARVERNTEVTIGFGEGVPGTPTTNKPVIEGTVYGAGAGLRTHGYSALVRGHSSVTIEGNAKVMQSVYGGGMLATVGRYQVTNNIAEYNISGGKSTVTIGGYAEIGPDDMVMKNETTGKPDDYGHVFGAGKGTQPYEGFADTVEPWSKTPNGETTYAKFKDLRDNEDLPNDYVKYLRTLALTTKTDVIIKDHAFVKGSVYGGSENGFVQEDTHVTIQDDCQIGNGYVQMADDGTYLDKLSTPLTPLAVNRRYTDEEWAEGHLIMGTNDRQALKDLVSPDENTTYYSSSLPECASWTFGQAENAADKYAPYDKDALSTGYYDTGGTKTAAGGRPVADDGHTFFGNVFGGGSGYYPYKPGRWFEDAGAVYGDTYVTIKGGHILTSVYGGNEMTDVGKYDDNDRLKLTSGGTCYVTMIDGTLGVPRTLKQIDAHPVTCYLFGAGKGDQRVFFNKSTNVGNVVVHISDDARIYGSVFGGGEDGHVMQNVTMNIGGSTLPLAVSSNSVLTSVFTGVTLTGKKTKTKDGEDYEYPYIGTWGTSYVEGNVFGAGRGFGGDAYTAGNVAGSVTMNIYGGTMLGSVYGGGRLGSVGYGLFNAGVPGYGEMRPDNNSEEYDGDPITGVSDFNRGHVDITISGGIIGNKWEFVDVDPNTAPANLATWKTNHNVPNTEYEEPEVVTIDNQTSYYYRLKHTKGGNVFAGGMGRQKQVDGQTPIDPTKIDWMKLGNVKQTSLTITGGTIMSNVYGGGELGAVTPYVNGTTVEGGTTQISISGTAAIGTVIEKSVTIDEVETKVPVYTFGSVYGGGMGNETDQTSTDVEARIGGLVKGSTTISMTAGEVKGSVYGGGEMAVVQGSHTVADIEDNTKTVNVGTEINISGTAKIGYNQEGFGGATMGNVYGAGKGSLNTKEAGLIKKNTLISISGTPNIYHNIYGGGAYGSVGTFTYETPTGSTQPASTPSGCTEGTGTAWITITGGTIGINGHENGMVFGSSRGDVAAPVPDATTGEDPNNKLAWVSNTYVTIGTEGQGTTYTTPWIRGSVYGSGENGHVLNNTNVAIHSGKIGIEENDGRTYDITSGSTTYKGAEYGTRGNVYGGGCGTDTYDITGSDAVTKHYFNRSAGVVRGNATITMDGGKVVRSIYGGGAMGSVGKFNRSDKTTDDPYYYDSHVPGFISSCTPNTGLCSVTISGGQVGPSDTTLPDGAGNVFGASRGEIQVATLYPNLDRMVYVDNTEVSINGTATIKGSVYGGGETGNVMDNTEVNVCAEKQTSGTTVTYAATSGTPTIGGNVYGGGKGVADNFTCDKAMVGLVDQGVRDNGEDEDPRYTLLDGGTTVRIYNGTVGTLVNGSLKDGTGNVYGGGEVGRVERNTEVEIGAASGTSEPTIRGNVFAAGAGVVTHGYSALVRGHSTVTVQGGAKVLKNVYGGGELASVGRYWVAASSDEATAHHVSIGMPYGLKAGGTSSVIVRGSATIGTSGVATTGHVYGAGQGAEPRDYDYVDSEHYTGENPYNIDYHFPKRWVGNGYVPLEDKPAYLAFLETLALSAETDVTIAGSATVYGSVFGGSESGFVYRDTDVKIQGGTVQGNVFGGGRGLESFAEAGRVRGNTGLAISNGAVWGNVYGGGNLGDVGTIDKTDQTDYNYIWKNSLSNGSNMVPDSYNNTPLNNTIISTESNPNTNTGICTVSISGGTIGIDNPADKTRHGNVFGAGQGSWHTWWCEKAIVYATNISVSKGTVKGNVYGGGEVGRVEDDAKVTIGDPSVTDALTITGSVYGAGAGLATHGYSALVRGNSDVIVQGSAQIGGSVYGGGEIASVGKFVVDKGLPKEPKNGGTCTVKIQGNAKIGTSGTTHNVFGACKGVTPAYNNTPNDPNRSKSMQLVGNKPDGAAGTTWDEYEDENGNKDARFIWRYYSTDTDYLNFLKTLALTSNTHVTIGGSSEVYGSVYGGGERGVTLGGADVNMTGGTVYKDIYGGGALADTNTAMWDTQNNKRNTYVALPYLITGSPATGYYTAKSANALIKDPAATVQSGTTYYAIYKTNVNLTGGTVGDDGVDDGNVYGGGLGQLAKAAVNYTQAEANAYNAEHSLNAGDDGFMTTESVKTPAQSAIPAKVYGDVLVKLNETTATDNCVVKGKIFGCNNLNGSPQSAVTVHIYKTEDYTGHEKDASKSNTKYNVEAVYGGGNLAAFIPDYAAVADTAVVRVIIDGCNLTSIGTVYGGGNAASVPATEVTVNGTYEIGQAFGGGNGKDNYQLDGEWYENPGANVGLKNYTHLDTSGTTPGTEDSPYYLAKNNTTAEQGGVTTTNEDRKNNYGYGIGKSHISIYGGTVHAVYGGSNKRGNVRVESRTTLEDLGCDFTVGDAYGGGNNAPQDGDAVLEIGCIGGMEKAYGGAANADVNGNVVLNITNGTYGQVFGGNDAGGAIRGSITVNIEETGCKPVIIGELYGGGCNAAYSVYGYNDDGSVKETGSNPVADPVVNVKSFTSIGSIFGGGYGAPATMVGNPQVNINVTKGKYSDQTSETYFTNKGFVLDTDATKKRYSKVVDATDNPHTVYVPTHEADKIGAIYNVFGGGNAADVIGTPHVNIGTLTGEVITLVSQKIEDSEGRTPSDANWIPSYQLATVEGVDIRDNVYGAGNNANVTGNTDVVIGKDNSVKTYRFTSYGSSSGEDVWSSGLAQTTGVTKNNLAEVVILTNGQYGAFVGQKFYVNPSAKTDGSERTELKDKNGASLTTPLYVAIKPFEQKKTYTFTSYGESTGGTAYSTGTAAPTGNFKTFSSKEYMQIVVLTNPEEVSWEGRTFYVPMDAPTGGSTRTQLYKADGTTENVWVSISE